MISEKSAKPLFHERSVIDEFIQKHKDVYPIESNILKVSHSSYNYWITEKPSERLIRRLELEVSIKNVYDWSKDRYGSPRIVKELQMQGKWVY